MFNRAFRCASTALFLLCGVQLTIQAAPPTGLMTDLMEHTDRVWIDGYPSQLTLQGASNILERHQSVEIFSERPTFGWVVNDSRNDVTQTAYQLMVASSPNLLNSNTPDLWDTGVYFSARTAGLTYGAEAPLEPNKIYYWKVRSENNGTWQEWSSIKAFRTASELSDYATPSYPLVKTDEIATSITTTPRGGLLIDFGRDSFGQLSLTLTAQNEGDTVVLYLGEALRGGEVDRTPDGTIRTLRQSLALMAGTHTYKIKIPADPRNARTAPPTPILMPDYVGEVYPFRYCEIQGYDLQLEAHQAVRQTVTYPFNDCATSFSSSSETLNAVWELCRYTMKATSFAGIYVDGDRERIPYEADALINQLSHYGVDREFTLARLSHEYLLHNATWPTEWVLQSLLIAWYDYLYTGDIRSAKKYLDELEARTLIPLADRSGIISVEGNPAANRELFDRVNLPKNQALRDIVDWPRDEFEFCPQNISPNAFHCAALTAMSQLCNAMGERERGERYAKLAKNTMAAFEKSFFNNRSGLYVDGVGSGHISLYSNTFPVALGITKPTHYKRIASFLTQQGMGCSVYGAQFLLEALYELGEEEAALQLLTATGKRSWYNMLAAGSTLTTEAWDLSEKPNQDWNHAWGAAPGNIIPRKLMGITPLQAGWERIQIKPQVGSLEHASITLPTLRGTIAVEVVNQSSRFILNCTLPANTKTTLYIPIPKGITSSNVRVEHNGELVPQAILEGKFIKIATVGSGTHSFVLTQKY